MTHRLNATNQISTINYEADLARMKEDMANMFKSKLGLDMGRSRLYQRPYVDAFDLIPYPAGWHFLIPLNLAVIITDSLGSILANISLNLAKLVLVTFYAFVCFHYF